MAWKCLIGTARTPELTCQGKLDKVLLISLFKIILHDKYIYLFNLGIIKNSTELKYSGLLWLFKTC